jgi:hypothetical protein
MATERAARLVLLLTLIACAGCAAQRQRMHHPGGTSPTYPSPGTTTTERPSERVPAVRADRSPIEAPAALRDEHLAIQAALLAATQAPDPIGPVAIELARIAQPHFLREDEIALPPLGLLETLAAGDDSPALREVLPLTDALREELPRMLDEHAEIVAGAQQLEQVAAEVGDVEVQLLARVLQAHAQAEEDIFYPAALLVGEVVRTRLGEQKAAARE